MSWRAWGRRHLGRLSDGLFASKAVNAPVMTVFFSAIRAALDAVISVVVTSYSPWSLRRLFSDPKRDHGLRVADDEERMGLDLTQHNERAYE